MSEPGGTLDPRLNWNSGVSWATYFLAFVRIQNVCSFSLLVNEEFYYGLSYGGAVKKRDPNATSRVKS